MRYCVIQVVTSPFGGGAQFIAKSLAMRPNSDTSCNSIVYFSNPNLYSLDSNETSYDLSNPRSLRAIYLLRETFRQISCAFDKVIVHSHLTWPFYYCAIASIGLSNLQLVYTEHNTSNKRRNIPLLKFIDRYIYNMYTKVISISDSTQLFLLKWLGLYDTLNFNGKFLIIPNGTRSFSDLNIRKNYTHKPLHMISIGTLNHKKGFDIAIQAIKLVENYVGQYIILGEGPMRPELQTLINRLNLQDCVKLVGYTNQVQDFLDNVDIGLVPSRIEGFGLCAIELLSAGIPIVCTNIPGISEVLHDSPSVHLTDGISREAIAAGVLNGYRNLAFREDISKLAISYSRKYSIEKMLSSYQAVYIELLNH